jgi:DNA-binding MarR family transcriptional regulator
MNPTEILIKIRKIVRAINLESKKIQKEHGVSIPQVLCLSFLKEAKNFQATQSEIRNFLNLNASTTSGIIDRLENKGLLARLPRSGDKRKVTIALTSQGDHVLNKIPYLLHDQLSRKLLHLPPDKIKSIEESLEKVIELLEISDVEASPLLTIEENLNETDPEPTKGSSSKR